ncbi:hypothetical protein VTH82DRAFT_1559 [Thermothelomyces myriococcoides]
MTNAGTTTFHPFPRLPFELRARIWELTVEPRIVDVRVVYHDPSPVKVTDPFAWSDERMKKRLPPRRHLRSSTPVPAQLQTCQEAREHLSKRPYGGYCKAFSEIMTTPYDGFDPVPEDDPQGERDRYVWLNFEIDVVSVAYLVCLEGIRAGYKVTDDIYFPCGPENVYFVNPEKMGDMMMRSVDLDAIMDREEREWEKWVEMLSE